MVIIRLKDRAKASLPFWSSVNSQVFSFKSLGIVCFPPASDVFYLTLSFAKDQEATWDQITNTVFVPIQLSKTLGSCLKQQSKTDILDVEEKHSSGKHSNLNGSSTHPGAKIIICVFFASVYQNVIHLKYLESYYWALEHSFCPQEGLSQNSPGVLYVCVSASVCWTGGVCPQTELPVWMIKSGDTWALDVALKLKHRRNWANAS